MVCGYTNPAYIHKSAYGELDHPRSVLDANEFTTDRAFLLS